MDKKLAALACLLLIGCASPLAANELSFLIEVDQPVYQLGQTVNWTIGVQTDNSTGDNFGISSLDVDLFESQPETLSPATSFGPEFAGYDFTYPGDAAANAVIGITASEFNNDGSAAQIGGGGPSVFAVGSYPATILGEHDLTGSFSSDAQHWIASSGYDMAAFNPVIPGSKFFVVAPEPGTCAMLLSALAGLAVVWYRRR